MNGTWVTGIQGTLTLTNFTQSLQKKYVAEAKQYLGESLLQYEPWMSLRKYDPSLNLARQFVGPTKILAEMDQILLLNEALKAVEGQLTKVGDVLQKFRLPLKQDEIPGQFSETVHLALKLIYQTNPVWKSRFQHLVQLIVPLVSADPDRPLREMGSGLSVHWFKGCIFISLPRKFDGQVIELAINLVHELGHQALMIYQNCDRILAMDPMVPIFSAVRRTHRPAVLSFHALIALAYMVEFLDEVPSCVVGGQREYALQRRSELRKHFREGLAEFSKIQFTEFGRSLYEEFVNLSESGEDYA